MKVGDLRGFPLCRGRPRKPRKQPPFTRVDVLKYAARTDAGASVAGAVFRTAMTTSISTSTSTSTSSTIPRTGTADSVTAAVTSDGAFCRVAGGGAIPMPRSSRSTRSARRWDQHPRSNVCHRDDGHRFYEHVDYHGQHRTGAGPPGVTTTGTAANSKKSPAPMIASAYAGVSAARFSALVQPGRR